ECSSGRCIDLLNGSYFCALCWQGWRLLRTGSSSAMNGCHFLRLEAASGSAAEVEKRRQRCPTLSLILAAKRRLEVHARRQWTEWSASRHQVEFSRHVACESAGPFAAVISSQWRAPLSAEYSAVPAQPVTGDSSLKHAADPMATNKDSGADAFYLRYYIGHRGHIRATKVPGIRVPADGKLRLHANNSNYKNDTMIRKGATCRRSDAELSPQSSPRARSCRRTTQQVAHARPGVAGRSSRCLNSEHISFTPPHSTDWLAGRDHRDKDPDGLRTFYYLVQDLKCLLFRGCSESEIFSSGIRFAYPICRESVQQGLNVLLRLKRLVRVEANGKLQLPYLSIPLAAPPSSRLACIVPSQAVQFTAARTGSAVALVAPLGVSFAAADPARSGCGFVCSHRPGCFGFTGCSERVGCSTCSVLRCQRLGQHRQISKAACLRDCSQSSTSPKWFYPCNRAIDGNTSPVSVVATPCSHTLSSMLTSGGSRPHSSVSRVLRHIPQQGRTAGAERLNKFDLLVDGSVCNQTTKLAKESMLVRVLATPLNTCTFMQWSPHSKSLMMPAISMGSSQSTKLPQSTSTDVGGIGGCPQAAGHQRADHQQAHDGHRRRQDEEQLRVGAVPAAVRERGRRQAHDLPRLGAQEVGKLEGTRSRQQRRQQADEQQAQPEGAARLAPLAAQAGADGAVAAPGDEHDDPVAQDQRGFVDDPDPPGTPGR
uniref:HTH OST-type domain-containing protein n=1 Tax=Macrostomum lignano TaxID=282301 RepID=A0A1I8IY85_9PLAT